MIAWLQENYLDLLGLAIICAAAYPANGIWRVIARVPWKQSEVGRVLHGKAITIALVLDLSLIANVLRLLDLGRPVWFEILRLITFLGVAVALWKQRAVFRAIAANDTPTTDPISTTRHQEPQS